MIDIYLVPEDFKIVSGGQTGADQAGLEWAIEHGVPHGGWCPKGRRSEDGAIDPRFTLTETPSANYLERTEWNVRDSDATLIVTMGATLDGGSKQTAEFAKKLGKPWLHFRPGVHPKFIARFLDKHKVKTLNVAGKRESSAPGVSELTRQTLSAALQVNQAG
jgi:hypothetical protein